MRTWILTCPQCGSANIIYETGMITGQKYRCLKCGYIGAFAVEKEIEVYEDGFPEEHGVDPSGEHDA